MNKDSLFDLTSSCSFVSHTAINDFIGGPLENKLVEGRPFLKELNINTKI